VKLEAFLPKEIVHIQDHERAAIYQKIFICLKFSDLYSNLSMYKYLAFTIAI